MFEVETVAFARKKYEAQPNGFNYRLCSLSWASRSAVKQS